MENELQQSLPEPADFALSAAPWTPASLPPRADPLPSANLYDDLKDGECRLLELDINTPGTIVGRLQTFEVSSAPPFYALSYVCGSDARSEEITINGRAVLVRPNLFAALQEIWSNFRDENLAQLAIWIDAICIKQDNEEEKSRQIRSMHGVFSGAEEVLVWLGTVDDNIRMVLRVFAWISLYRDIGTDFEAFWQHHSEPGYMESIEQHKLEAIQSLLLLSICLRDRYRVSHTNLCAMACLVGPSPDLLEDDQNYPEEPQVRSDHAEDERIRAALNMPTLNAGLFPPDHVFWATLYALLNLEWFGRAWTFQELMLARKARFVTQDIWLPSDVVLNPMDVLLRALIPPGPAWPIASLKCLPQPTERHQSALSWVQFTGDLSDGRQLSVLFSLILTKRRVSTIAKDKVYGLVALWESEAQAEVVIDYARPTAEVFANAVKMGLKIDGEVFSIADLWDEFDGPDHPRQVSATDELPSWCPDFHRYTNSPKIVNYQKLSTVVKDRIRALACYEHTSGFETISIRVLKLDTITKRMKAACPGASQQTGERYSALMAWLRELSETFPSKRQANRSLRRDLQISFYEETVILHPPGFTFDLFSESLGSLICVLPWQSAGILQDIHVRLTLDLLAHQFGRIFFLTDSGRIGYSASHPCSDGHIVLVPGKLPKGPLHMLNADCTRYVGCASVFGLMDDSLLDSLDHMETKWEMVCLR